MPKTNQEKGFSLIEIIAAILIFSIASVGLFSTFAAQRESTERSERRLQAAYLGRQVLEELRAKIDAMSWDSGDLSEGVHLYPTNSALFNVSYTVINAAAGGRKVTLTINYAP